jgi:5-formyltetrahydrofolate cyclo-ligase
MMINANDKQSLRRYFLQQRRTLSPEVWQQCSESICDRLMQSDRYQQARTILAYVSHHQEPDLSLLFKDRDKQWGLPRCVGKNLCWHVWQPSQPLVTGSYDLLEPAADLPLLNVDRVDLILIPAVAIDRRGYRLGYGGGYYDRLRADPAWAKIPTIGITFEFAYVDTLPIDPWDLPLAAVCHESAIVNLK